MRVSFARGAWAEVTEAQRFYASISPSLADDFTAALDQAVKRVVQEPLMWPPLTKRIRRCLFDRFPYGLIYRVEGDAITVLTVMHERRRPGYWRGR